MQFLYPTNRQFPFDEVCEQIVRALSARDWNVPGFLIEFDNYGSGAQKLRYVSKIRSDQLALDLTQHDITINFGRPQGRLPEGKWNDIAAVSAVCLPRRELHVYDDESGPTYHVYVGEAWELDRSTWWSRPNARLKQEPRVCVKYSGATLYRNTRAARLIWHKDDREYGPEGAEPQTFRTNEIMEEVRTYLHDIILPAIEAHPVTNTTNVYVEPPPMAMPADLGTLFTYGEYRDVARIELGKKCLEELPLADRYGMLGNGLRLAPLGIKHGKDLPEVAFDGFLWCGTTPWVPSEHQFWSAAHLLKVSPKDARGVYVADHAAYERRRKEIGAACEEQRNYFTDDEINDFIRARACTILPVTEYKGGYEKPVYLINRELDFDEVEVIGMRPQGTEPQ